MLCYSRAFCTIISYLIYRVGGVVGRQPNSSLPLYELSSIMMALRRLSMRAPTGVRQMSGHSIEEAIRA